APALAALALDVALPIFLAGGDVVGRRGGRGVARAVGVRALDLGQVPALGDVLGGRVAARLDRLRADLLAVADRPGEVAAEVEGGWVDRAAGLLPLRHRV